MTRAVLAVVLASGFGMYAFAQTDTLQPGVSLSLEADSIERMIPVRDIGVIKPGPAAIPLSAKGNVVISINGVRVTADSAEWVSGSNVIDLNGGSARVEFSGRVNSFRIGNRP